MTVNAELREHLGRLAEASGASCRLTLVDEDGNHPLLTTLSEGEGDPERLRLPLEGARGRAGGGALEVAWPRGDDAAGRVAKAVAETARRLLVQDRELDLFSRELAERYEQITLLTTISDVLGSVIRPDRAAELILGELVAALGGGRATLWLPPEDGVQEGRLRPFVCRGRCDPTAEAVVAEARIAHHVFGSQQALLSGPSDPSGPSGERDAGGVAASPASLLAVPVSYAPTHAPHRRLGVLSILADGEGVAFSAGELRLLEAVAHQIGAAVQAGRLVEESLRRERTMAELDLAHDLQLKLLPHLEGFSDLAEVSARSEPAEVVGGDFYLLIRLPRDRLGVMLGDVSSHGFSAALIMALIMSTAAIYAREREEPGEVLERIHGQLRDDLASTEMYTSIFYGILDPREERLRYANAGHPFAWRVREDGGSRLGALDPPLGMTGPRGYGQTETEWRPARDLLVLCTDGLVSGFDDELRVAEERLVASAVRAAGTGPGAVVEALFAPAEVRERADDRTALALAVRERPG